MEKYRIDKKKGLELGLYSIGDHLPNPHTGTQIDFGGVPFERIAKNIEFIATEIMPAIKKHTAKN